jgi:hypothetical protein
MPFQPNQSGNAKGREQGVPNKLTKATKERLKAVLDANLTHLQNNDSDLTNGERIAFVRALLPFVMPKLQSVVLREGEPISHFKSIDINIVK